MSAPTEPSSTTQRGKGASFVFVFAIFAFFAVVLSFLQAWKGDAPPDARAEARLANTAEIKKAQGDLITRMGLDDHAKAAALFEKTATALKSKAPAASKTVVPGSPTQLKMAPPAAPVPAPAAPAK